MENKVGCLLIHGFGGSPEEMDPLAEYLRNEGITTLSPVLKGHTGKNRTYRGFPINNGLNQGKMPLTN